jgi:membrane glycosyltransferase
MDGLSAHAAQGAAGPAPLEFQSGMPPETPAVMPEQSFRRFDPATRRADADREQGRLLPRRILVLGGAVALSAAVGYEMYQVLKVAGLTLLEAVVLVFFILNFAWIALAFMTAAVGMVLRLHGTLRRKAAVPTEPPAGRTAVVMLTYNEDASRIFAAIEAMAAGMAGLGAGGRFDWFVLSDTTDATTAIAEEDAFTALRARLGGRAALHYRRRRHNTGRKVGNVADFCRRWGGAYDYLLVLDADSLMEPATMLELARRMDADPATGLIQTVPRLINGQTVFARVTQFAGRIYGPLLSSGLAWWTGTEGNYWGHNAIVRRQAFTSAAGLPELPGKAPFGGQILSHDFVEAALIRRAGWSVRIAADLEGSYEESPPSLIDLAVRDRRWCQGNMQHARLLFARGLHWASRFHLANGIAGYLASPLWLMLIGAGLLLALQARYLRIDYFGKGYTLFPLWPAIDPMRALRLLVITTLVLFGPKIMGFIATLADRDARRRAGGALRLAASVLAEVVVSALIAPVMLLIQTGLIFSIVTGRDSGWKPQSRDHKRVSKRALFARHWHHVAAGVVLAVAAFAVSNAVLFWLLPAIVGMLLAIPLSGLTASARIGFLTRRTGLLRIPEERIAPPVNIVAKDLRLDYRAVVHDSPDLAGVIRDERRRRIHFALMDRAAARKRGRVDAVEATAMVKIGDAHSLEEAVGFLDAKEAAAAFGTPSLLDRLTAFTERQGRSAA